jgi:hypothetical protein
MYVDEAVSQRAVVGPPHGPEELPEEVALYVRAWEEVSQVRGDSWWMDQIR